MCDLPFDPVTMDVVCRRDADGTLHFNVPQAVVHHSPDGFEWGHGGGGPADFALNVLHLFLPPLGPVPAGCLALGREDVQCFRGVVSGRAWELHQEFKWRFIATLPRRGGTIAGDAVRAWVEAQPAEGAAARRSRR